MPRINTFQPDNVDVRVLKEIVRFGWMSTGQIAERYFLPPCPCPRRITRLVQHGLLKRVERFRVTPLYVPTPLGARRAGIGLKAPRKIDENDVYHDLAVVDVADHLTSNLPGSHWLSERQLRSLATRRARQFRSPLPGHYPDGVLVDATRRWIAIEVELSKKDEVRYRKILRDYAELPEIAAVRWYVPSHSIRKLLERAMCDCDYTGQDMTVHDLPSCVGQRR